VRLDHLYVVDELSRLRVDGDDRVRIEVLARSCARLKIRSGVAGRREEGAGLRVEREGRPERATGDGDASRVAPAVPRRAALGHDVEPPHRMAVLLIERPDVTGHAVVVAAGVTDEDQAVPRHR